MRNSWKKGGKKEWREQENNSKRRGWIKISERAGAPLKLEKGHNWFRFSAEGDQVGKRKRKKKVVQKGDYLLWEEHGRKQWSVRKRKGTRSKFRSGVIGAMGVYRPSNEGQVIFFLEKKTMEKKRKRASGSHPLTWPRARKETKAFPVGGRQVEL